MDATTSLGGILVLRWWLMLGLSLLSNTITPLVQGYTYDQDVYAINNLYTALGSPPIPGWIPNGGDPCLESWQGVRCVGSNITGIILNSANLGGELGDKLVNFTSIITIDLSNNHIGGSIPENLPITMRELFLSANLFTGSIPSSLSDLTLLSAMSLNNNLLTGGLPDSFQFLGFLTNLDLSFNNLTGQLPSSMQSLSSLATMHIQNNQLSGTLDVLQDLPLLDLNIENNLFSGPVPVKLFNIPTFRKDGNPFNTSLAPAPSVPSGQEPTPLVSSGNGSRGSSSQGTHTGALAANNKKSTGKIVLIVFSVVAGIIVLVILVVVSLNCFLSKQRKRNSDQEKASAREGRVAYERSRIEPRRNINLSVENNEVMNAEIPKASEPEPELDVKKLDDYEIDRMGVVLLHPPPVDNDMVNLIDSQEATAKSPSPKKADPQIPPTTVTKFSVASLQQYTASFSESNLIIEGKLGKFYHADLPEGKQLKVMKLDSRNSALPDDLFHNLVVNISEIHHPNILELVGYCAEYGQQLLVYNYFGRRTLRDVLHDGDDIKRTLSWNVRIQVALGAARALEYLHEDCQPSVIHQNFESASVLFNDELAVRICDCGLASILSSNSASQISGRIHSLFSYEAPEISDSGTHTDRSDVYSFGVVMLELLTGRAPYDSSRPRAEQYLVRWASSQLHDINTLTRMVDPAIAGNYPVKSLSRFADIISRCIQGGAEFRPPMSEVVQDLTRMVEEMNKADENSSFV